MPKKSRKIEPSDKNYGRAETNYRPGCPFFGSNYGSPLTKTIEVFASKGWKLNTNIWETNKLTRHERKAFVSPLEMRGASAFAEKTATSWSDFMMELPPLF